MSQFLTEHLEDVNIDTAKKLYLNGYAFVPFAYTHIARDASSDFRKFLENVENPNIWCITSPGEASPDDGLIFKNSDSSDHYGDVHDRKSFFHYKRRLPGVLLERNIYCNQFSKKLLRSGASLFDVCENVALNVAHQLDIYLGTGEQLTKAFWECSHDPSDLCHSGLRLLHYPRRKYGEVFCARPHRDKSFLTVHVGDVGGKLYWAKSKTDEPENAISPNENQALVFWGRKGRMLSERLCLLEEQQLPDGLWHLSAADHGFERTAAVFFGHINIPLEHA